MKKEKIIQSYPEEMLIACQNGKPCSYGICDECPNTLRNVRSDEDDEENEKSEQTEKDC